MRLAVGLFLPVAAAILGCWWWLGAPVAMPPSPLEAGEKLSCASYTPFRGSETPLDLTNLIRSVNARISVPVTYADVWEFWLRYPEVQAAVDFVTIHILPYWEDFPVPASEAAAHVESIRQKLKAAFPDKEILIGEVGWPSAGRMRDGALPSRANQARVVQDVLAAAKREHYRVSVIEAFDQPWKEQQEGTVGGHWGLLDGKTREFKFAWGAAVSDHPYWRWQAAAGIALAG